MVQQQPMKVAAAEALYTTQENAPFSILSIGDVSGDTATTIIEMPGLLSFLATGTFDGPESTVQGINDLQAQYLAEYPQYGPEHELRALRAGHLLGLPPDDRPGHDRRPVRADRAVGCSAAGAPRRAGCFAVFNSVIVLFPLFGISAGWIFTEMGRQPWIVFGQQITADGSLAAAHAVRGVGLDDRLHRCCTGCWPSSRSRLLLKYIKAGAPETVVEDPYADAKKDDDKQLYFAY